MTEPSIPTEFEQTPQQLVEAYDADVWVYNADVSDRPAQLFWQKVASTQGKRQTAALFMTTWGGDLNAAYRIARTLQDRYRSFRLLVSGPCVSAGTLVASGASELAFGPLGELGPMDVQIRQNDEIVRWRSGLDTAHAFQVLQDRTFDAFEAYLLGLVSRSGSTISTLTAATIATQLVTGLIQPIASQIDPYRIAEVDRQLAIAETYAERLAKSGSNLERESIARLVHSYPAHQFIIDFNEASSLFRKVRKMNAIESAMMLYLDTIAWNPADAMIYVGPFLELFHDQSANESGAQDGEPSQVSREQDDSRPAEAEKATGTPASEPANQSGARKKRSRRGSGRGADTDQPTA